MQKTYTDMNELINFLYKKSLIEHSNDLGEINILYID